MERRSFIKERKQEQKTEININKTLPEVANLTTLGISLEKTLKDAGVDKKTIETVKKTVIKTQKEKEQKTQEVQKSLNTKEQEQETIIAIFQTQATLGKVMTHVFHETRNYLQAIRSKIPTTTQWNDNIIDRVNQKLLIRDEYINQTSNKILNNLKLIEAEVNEIDIMYKKLKPLSITKRRPKKTIILKSAAQNVIQIFDSIIRDSKIVVNLNCPNELKLTLWEDDLAAILINLIDNSIYWLNEADKIDKKIDIYISEYSQKIIFDILDNGIGLTEKEIAQHSIFDLGYSKKTDGTGIGLYVAGDATRRNKGELKALYSPFGAHFQVTFLK